jgi:hypothetical protein
MRRFFIISVLDLGLIFYKTYNNINYYDAESIENQIEPKGQPALMLVESQVSNLSMDSGSSF